MKFLGAVTVLIVLAAYASAQQTTCYTLSRQIGNCIAVKNCPSVLRVLQGPKPLSDKSLAMLRSLQCGFEGRLPKVCCDIQSTATPTPSPDGGTPTTSANPPDVTGHRNLRLLDHELCGPVTQGKIFGGNKTGVFDFPWMALIAYQTRQGPDFRCGGSIVNKRYVLTAAHCVTNLPDNIALTGVRLGDHDLSTERDCDRDEDGMEIFCAERYQDFGIESFHYHHDYRASKSPQNDIALIRLDNDADFRPTTVRPICMPVGSAFRIGQKKVTVTGWGATEKGPRSQDLLRVLVPVVAIEQCATTYKKSTQIWYKQMCAGGHNRMDSCLGDSGGPVQSPGLYMNNVKYIQHGIVSFGTRQCGIEGFPGVYTRVGYYLDWILDTMRD